MKLYKEFYIDRDYEQLDLFEQLAADFSVQSVLYPGSYVHISPSFYIPYACYVDTDKKAKKFFADLQELAQTIQKKAHYDKATEIRFYGQDYTLPTPEKEHSFDLLVSQYAGFISEPCKRYLKPGGLLLVNNSHGDAGIAALDNDFTLCGVFNRRNGKYIFSQRELERYFIPKKEAGNLYRHIQETGKGIAYTKTATLYLFRYSIEI